MAKFTKDGSVALDGAVKLARAGTGRDLVALCADHPFFSSSDWFIGTTPMPAGIPPATRALSLKFPYGDLPALERLFAEHPGAIACVVLEPARLGPPPAGYLPGVAALCRREGAAFILDETMTGFRWHLQGGKRLADVEPDLAVYGKAMANGFACSALTGRREWMELGGVRHARERVFLLSTTHGGETHTLAAGLATLRFYQRNPVIETLYARGAQLRAGVETIVAELGLQGRFELAGPDCALLYGTRDAAGRPSQPFRTLFLQELCRHGVLAPSFVVSWSHGRADVDRTLEAVRASLRVYRDALEAGVERFLQGPPVKPVFRPYA
jgi:glutamate-1-semialdehyde 2,1-aminomutase